MIKSPSVHSNNFSLQNLDNYLKTVDPKLKIFNDYNIIITEYLELCTINISINDISYAKFIIHKGIEMISHIFNHIFLYTKNIELCKHYCSKASHYYIEFIGQIGEDSHSFLQLNSKDAILFVYKKTIFEINNNYRKNYSLSDKEHKVLNILKKETDVINNILFVLLDMIEHTNVRRFLKQCICEKKDILSNLSTE